MNHCKKSRFVSRFFQIAALAAMVALTVSVKADDRGVKSRVSPIYPDIARRMHVEGTVSIQATIDAAGNVVDAKASGGNALLGPAAEDAVRKWKFDGGAGESKVKVNVEFVLSH